ncbi:MAG: glycine--tRNA ligase [Patescibacteria group bacterium]
MEKEQNNLMEKIISLSKRRGFVYQGSEIYGGLAGTWDYGPLGVALKNNIKDAWRKKFISSRTDMYEVDAAILMNSKAWEASGHVAGFTDPTLDGKQFNVMFKTQVGAGEEATTSYLRPETAQGVFVNFKNIVDSFHPKLPFGIAQIGKAFRNEIAPRDFIFRVREFEQMEIEYFIQENNWEKYFTYWKDELNEFIEGLGLDMNLVHEIEIGDGDRAHYSKRTIDFEFEYPFGQKELFGLAYRGSFDLDNHKLDYIDEEAKGKIVPHVIEPSMGIDRLLLALLLSSYKEDEQNGEVRAYLALKPSMAPVICAVSPLLKNKSELVDKAHLIYGILKAEFGRVMWDDNGNIGKRYRRQDEIGTPWCIVIDFDTLTDDSVTIRDRDTGAQERIKQDKIVEYIKNKLG